MNVLDYKIEIKVRWFLLILGIVSVLLTATHIITYYGGIHHCEQDIEAAYNSRGTVQRREEIERAVEDRYSRIEAINSRETEKIREYEQYVRDYFTRESEANERESRRAEEMGERTDGIDGSIQIGLEAIREAKRLSESLLESK